MYHYNPNGSKIIIKVLTTGFVGATVHSRIALIRLWSILNLRISEHTHANKVPVFLFHNWSRTTFLLVTKFRKLDPAAFWIWVARYRMPQHIFPTSPSYLCYVDKMTVLSSFFYPGILDLDFFHVFFCGWWTSGTKWRQYDNANGSNSLITMFLPYVIAVNLDRPD